MATLQVCWGLERGSSTSRWQAVKVHPGRSTVCLLLCSMTWFVAEDLSCAYADSYVGQESINGIIASL